MSCWNSGDWIWLSQTSHTFFRNCSDSSPCMHWRPKWPSEPSNSCIWTAHAQNSGWGPSRILMLRFCTLLRPGRKIFVGWAECRRTQSPNVFLWVQVRHCSAGLQVWWTTAKRHVHTEDMAIHQSTSHLGALEISLWCQEHCCNVSLGEEGDAGCFDDFWTFHSYMAMSKAELGENWMSNLGRWRVSGIGIPFMNTSIISGDHWVSWTHSNANRIDWLWSFSFGVVCICTCFVAVFVSWLEFWIDRCCGEGCAPQF